MELDIFKYVAWAIPLAISFCGAWFFQFTTTDKKTHQKQFTKFGKIAFVFAIVGICLGAYLMIADDFANRDEKVKAKREIAKQVALAAEERTKSEKYRDEAKKQRDKLITQIYQLAKSGTISKSQFDEVAETVLTAEEIKQNYPDLAAAIENAKTLDDLWTVGAAAIAKNAAARFNSKSAACRGLYKEMGDTDGWMAQFKSTDSIVFSSSTSASWVWMSITDNKAYTTRPYDIFESKLYFEFENGENAPIECNQGSYQGFCRVKFTDSQVNGKLHSMLRKERVVDLLVETKDGEQHRIGISSTASQNLKLVGGCTAR